MKLQHRLNTFFIFLVSFFLLACGNDHQKSNNAPKEVTQTAEKSSLVITPPDLKGQLIDSQKTMPSPSVPLMVKELKEIERTEFNQKRASDVIKEITQIHAEEVKRANNAQQKNKMQESNKNQQIKEVLSSYKLPMCKGDKNEWKDCHAKIFRDGRLISEGELINGKREGKWIHYPQVITGFPDHDVPTIREYASNMRIDGDHAERSLRERQRRKEDDEKFEKASKNFDQNKLIMECIISGVLFEACIKRFENKFKE